MRGMGCIIAEIVYHKLKNKSLVDEDIKRAGFGSLSEALMNSRPFANVFFYRVRMESKWLFRLVRLFIKSMESVEINVTSQKIGKGFTIWHGYGTVIFCESIGDYCSVNQGVTIGRGKAGPNGRCIPVIGDNVNIYTNAVVFGGITVGNNVDIGAGAVVTHDVPDNCVVAAVPARVIKQKKQ